MTIVWDVNDSCKSFSAGDFEGVRFSDGSIVYWHKDFADSRYNTFRARNFTEFMDEVGLNGSKNGGGVELRST